MSHEEKDPETYREHPPEKRFTVHCPSGPVVCCEKHTRDLRGMMQFLGAHVAITPAEDNAECSNCTNEAKNDA